MGINITRSPAAGHRVETQTRTLIEENDCLRLKTDKGSTLGTVAAGFCDYWLLCEGAGPDNATSRPDEFNILDHKVAIDTIDAIETIDVTDVQTNDAENNNNQTPVDFIQNIVQ